MNLYTDQFSNEYDFLKPSLPPKKTLIIASTPRSGSHMLGHTLFKTEKFGFPLEYFQKKNLQEWHRELQIGELDELILKLFEKRTSSNGVFSVKMHYSHLTNINGFNNLSNYFVNPHIIFLTRKDVLDQAISLSIAQQTGVWIKGQTPISLIPPEYNYDQIESLLKRTLIDNASWQYLLNKSDIKVLNLSFEDILTDLQNSILKIFNFMGEPLENSLSTISPATSKQGNNFKDKWKEKFLAESDLSKELMSDNDKTKNKGLLAKFKSFLK